MNLVKRLYQRRRKAPSTTTAANATIKKKKKNTASNNNTNKWRSYLDKNSYKVYYYNIDTKVVQWHKPEELRGEHDDEYSADGTASTSSIATTEDTDGTPSSNEDDMIIIIKASSDIDANTSYSAEKMGEHMISSMIAMQQLVQNSTEKITESSKIVLSNIQQRVHSPPTLCASDGLDTGSDKKREEMTMHLLGADNDGASFVEPEKNTSNDIDNNVVDSGCIVLPSIFTCKLDDETANEIVMSKLADEIVPSNNNTLESASHYDIQSSIIQKSLYNDIDQTKSLLQSLSSDYRDTMDEYSYHAVVSKMNMIRREQERKEQIQDNSIQNGKTLDSLLELVHTDDTISIDSSVDETTVSGEIGEEEEGEDEGLLNAVQVFAKYLQHGLVTEGSDRYTYSSTV